jgi:Fic family protein
MSFDTREPYNELPLLPPVCDLETKPVLKRCVAANKALAELKGAGDLIPNQAVLINVIPLQEAKLSSEIENIVTTQDALFQAALDESRVTDHATKEVLRYRTALRRGFETIQAQPFRLHLMEELCGVLRHEKVKFRADEEVMLGNPVTQAVTYTPPVGAEVMRAKLDNLEEFLLGRDGDLDPLVRMAVAHYQFEAIHPFTDGNGRTGRILNILFLIHAGLLRIPVLYLSRHLIQHKAEYYRLLRGVTERGDWEAWLIFILTGVEETAAWTTGRILAIRDLFDQTLAHCRARLPSKVYSKELVELIFTQPYCKIQFLVEAGIAQRQTASEYLQELEKLGILKGEKRGREVHYKHPALVKVLTA